MKHSVRSAMIYGLIWVGLGSMVLTAKAETASAAAGSENVVSTYSEDGRYYTADDIPTFHVDKNGVIDWPAYSGFRRYHSECHVCHGPDGEGSSYAPALKKSAIDLDYYEFVNVVTNGRKKIDAAENSVMPAFGNNPNVMCYLDDIYVYLKGRGVEAIPRGRPPKKEKKSAVINEDENACLGH